MKNQAVIFAVIGVIAGIALGYVFGVGQGKKAGYATGVEAGKKEAFEAAAPSAVPKIVNPAEALPEINPFETVKTNPFEGAEYVNPFK